VATDAAIAAPTTYRCARESSEAMAGVAEVLVEANPTPQNGHAGSPAKTWRLQPGHRTMAFIAKLPPHTAVRLQLDQKTSHF
jgi:hypothetical protein